MKTELNVEYVFWFSDQELEDIEKELNETLFYLKHKELPLLTELLKQIHSHIEPSKIEGVNKHE